MKPVTVLVLLSLLPAAPALAREVEGVKLPDTLAVSGEKYPLVLNGAGVRTRFMTRSYVGALYLAQPITRAEVVLAATTTRVMRLQFLREQSAAQLTELWRDGIAANHTPFELQALRGRLSQFGMLMRDVKANDVLRLDLLPRGVTRVSFNDQLRGTVDGPDFQQALLKVWLGDKPTDRDLKQALLGRKH